MVSLILANHRFVHNIKDSLGGPRSASFRLEKDPFFQSSLRNIRDSLGDLNEMDVI